MSKITAIRLFHHLPQSLIMSTLGFCRRRAVETCRRAKINHITVSFARACGPTAPPKLDQTERRKHEPASSADDFAAIRTRLEELRREREAAQATESE